MADATEASAAPAGGMSRVGAFLAATRGRHGADWTDWASYVYLVLGTLLMFVPVAWLALSSLKTQAGLDQMPPTVLPYEPACDALPGRPGEFPLFRVTKGDHAGQVLAEVLRIGLQVQMVDLAAPETVIRVPVSDREPVMRLHAAWDNYTTVVARFDFLRYFWNSLFITVVATVITLLFNAMAAFALSKYNFRGRGTVFALILATLMVPPTIILVPNYLIASRLSRRGHPNKFVPHGLRLHLHRREALRVQLEPRQIPRAGGADAALSRSGHEGGRQSQAVPAE